MSLLYNDDDDDDAQCLLLFCNKVQPTKTINKN